jgi:hypothetical protein
MKSIHFLTMIAAAMLAAAAINPAAAEPPQVRNSSKVVGSSKANVKAKALSASITCEGGEIKRASSGHLGCSCGLNVRRIAVAKNHFRCDRPQVRNSSKTVGSSKSGVKAKHVSETEKDAPTPVSTGKPVSNASPGKAVPACRAAIAVTRHGAAMQGTGLATAVAAWEHVAKQKYGFHMGKWKYAGNKDSDCSRSPILWKCTVSARPCSPV